MAITTYIAFLRGINVGGQKKVPMEALRKLVLNAGFSHVKSYIQSGNLVFKSTIGDIQKIENMLSAAILEEFGFEVPVLVMSIPQIQDILAKNSFKKSKEVERNSRYFVLLTSPPEHKHIQAFQNEHYEHEEFAVKSHCVYLQCQKGYGKAKLNNNLIERKLGVLATTRNERTLNRLLEIALDL